MGDVIHLCRPVGVKVEYYFTIYQIDPENKEKPTWKKKKLKKKTLILKSKSCFSLELALREAPSSDAYWTQGLLSSQA